MTLHRPTELDRLPQLARNLWWSWHPEAQRLFEALAGTVSEPPHHNPVELLYALASEELEARARDQDFLGQYREVLAAFDAHTAGERGWLRSRVPDLADAPIAYFSAEFGVHSSLPLYSGGLGVLAGDVAKEASDLGVPIVGVGFMSSVDTQNRPVVDT